MYNGGQHGWMNDKSLAYANDAIAKLHGGVGPTLVNAARLPDHAGSDARPHAPATHKSDHFIPGATTGAPKSPGLMDVTPLDHYREKVETLRDALANLEHQLHADDDAEAQAKAQIDLATTSSEKQAAQEAYAALVKADATKKVAYNAEIAREAVEAGRLIGLKADEIAKYDALVDSYAKLNEKKKANGGLSDAEELKWENLKSAVADSDRKIAALTSQINANTAAMDRNANASTRAAKAGDAVSDAAAIAVAKLKLAYNDFHETEGQRILDSLRLFGMSAAQQVLFNQQKIDALDKDDGNYYANLKTYEKARNDAVIASLAVTPDTRARVDFSDPYYRTPARFAARRDSPVDDPLPRGIGVRRVR